MQNKLVQVSELVCESGLPIAALFRCTEFVFKEGIILGANNGKVVAHYGRCIRDRREMLQSSFAQRVIVVCVDMRKLEMPCSPGAAADAQRGRNYSAPQLPP